jgi:hypothetical protein
MPLAVITFTNPISQDEMGEFADDVVLGIREFIYRNAKQRTGKTEESIKAMAYGRQIVVDSSLPHAKSLDRGSQSSKVLWHLINRVVPLKLRDGRTIFRAVSLDSIRRGKWRTQPRQGMDFVRKGIEIAKGKGSLRSRLNFVVSKP